MSSELTNMLVLGALGAGAYYLYTQGVFDKFLGSAAAAGGSLPLPPLPTPDTVEPLPNTVPPLPAETIPPISVQDTQAYPPAAAAAAGMDPYAQQQYPPTGDPYSQQYPNPMDPYAQQYQQQQAPPGYPTPYQQQQSPYGYPPTGQQQQYQSQPYYPPQPSAPPPGMISSLYPMNVPSGPPYTSQTVKTYSQYSPYNQFNMYQEYRTPGTGQATTWPDDNRTFSDIDTTRGPQCSYCYSICRRSPYSYGCATCRMPCKKVQHAFIPPARGWTIAPVGQQPYYSGYLGMVWDNLLGKGATFAEMDDYSQKKRFDCHNKLKRRVRGKDNSFVSQNDYYYDRNNIKLAIE